MHLHNKFGFQKMAAKTRRNTPAFRRAMLLTSTLLAPLPAVEAWANESSKWGAHIELEGKVGTERHLGESMLFLPL